MMRMELFKQLLDFILPPRVTERIVRAASYEEVIALLSPARIEKGRCSITTLLPYKHPLVQALIVEAKFHGNDRAHRLLGAVLSDYLREYASSEGGLLPAIALVPIPLGTARLEERGYNQVEKICQYAKSELPIYTAVLARIRDTAPQTTLPRAARLENMRAAFHANGTDPSIAYLLIDDVCTTGATLSAGMAALTDAGAREVEAIALAH